MVRPAGHWADLGEHTFVLGIRILFWTYRSLGRLPFKLCLYPVVTYYWLTRRAARQASLAYLRRIQSARGALGHAPGWRDVWTHFLSFAEAIVDKLLAVSEAFPLHTVHAEEEADLLALLRQGRGAVIAVGHIGCMELCRVGAQRHAGLRLNVLVHTAHAQRFNRILKQLDPDSGVTLIQVTAVNPATAMLLADKLALGEFVVIAADRVPVFSGTTVSAEFLGHEAPWPVGPYVLAALLRCPLYAMACVRQSDGERRGNYVLKVRCLAEQVVLPRPSRQQALRGYAREFASWMEDVLSDAPFAWFNFYEFWAQASPSVAADEAGL